MLERNSINTSIYLPLLEQFCKDCPELFSCGYPYGPFIPYTFPKYESASEKSSILVEILFIGLKKDITGSFKQWKSSQLY